MTTKKKTPKKKTPPLPIAPVVPPPVVDPVPHEASPSLPEPALLPVITPAPPEAVVRGSESGGGVATIGLATTGLAAPEPTLSDLKRAMVPDPATAVWCKCDAKMLDPAAPLLVRGVEAHTPEQCGRYLDVSARRNKLMPAPLVTIQWSPGA